MKNSLDNFKNFRLIMIRISALDPDTDPLDPQDFGFLDTDPQ